MGKKIAIDFGTSNTVVALWNEKTGKDEILNLKHISKTYDAMPQCFNTPLIPSLINFNDGHIFIGREVFCNSLEFDSGTFRDMKRYILNKKSLPKEIGKGRKVSFFQAGEEFLSILISKIKEAINDEIEEIIFTIPVDASQDYHEWLIHMSEKLNIKTSRVIDEPVACATGYEKDIKPGDIFMFFDFGGGTLDIAIVKIELSSDNSLKSIVLGKSGANLGGVDIDNWLLQDFLSKNNDIHNNPSLLNEIENGKIKLSFQEKAEIRNVIYRREDFENILIDNNFFTIISDTIENALHDAEMKGLNKNEIKYLLLTGGSSLIPSVRKILDEKCYEPFILNPFKAVVSGACRSLSGGLPDDYIYNEYAIKHWIWSGDKYNGDYGYRKFIKRGVKYPVKDIAGFIVDAALSGQKELEFVIFEINHKTSEISKNEMIYNPHMKKYEIRNIRFNEYEDSLPLNEKNPLVIKLDPPSRGGEKRISMSFSIDENRMLRISAMDLKTNRVLYDDEPVLRLR